MSETRCTTHHICDCKQAELAIGKEAVEACRATWDAESDESITDTHEDIRRIEEARLEATLAIIRVVEKWDALHASLTEPTHE